MSYYSSFTETVVTIINSIFENNKGTLWGKPGHGGAIYFFGPGILNVANTTFKIILLIQVLVMVELFILLETVN